MVTEDSASAGLKIRAYQPGDEKALVELHRQVFGSAKTVEQWRWRYADHVQGPGYIFVAERDGAIVGQQSWAPFDLSYAGRRIKAALVCDTMVRADHRGQGLFSRLSEEAYQAAADKGVRAVFSFPNRQAYPGRVGSMGWHRIAVLKLFSLRLGWARLWGGGMDRVLRPVLTVPKTLAYSSRRRMAGPGVRLYSTGQPPAGIGEAVKEWSQGEALAFFKDEAYLKWRYAGHPQHRYVFHVLEADGRPAGLAVSRDCGAEIAVCELLLPAKQVDQAALLLSHLVHHHRASSAQRVIFFGRDAGFFDAAFGRAGFKAIPHSEFILCGRTLNDPDLERYLAQTANWTISYGDVDVV